MASRPTQPLSGYSTQARISLLVANLINNGRLRLWFATAMNPPDNDLASNPLEIFAQLERIVDRGKRPEDFDKVQSLLGSLRAWALSDRHANPNRVGQALMLIRGVEDGQLELLQPKMLELRNITPDRHMGGDEYIAENQLWREQRQKPAYDLDRTEAWDSKSPGIDAGQS